MQRTEPIDAETLLSTPLPPVRWLIPGLLPAGLSLLAGASNAGKSWLCLWLCLQLARGGEIWSRITVASMGFVLPTGTPSPRRTPPLLRGRPRTPIPHGRLPREEPHRGHQRAGDTG